MAQVHQLLALSMMAQYRAVGAQARALSARGRRARRRVDHDGFARCRCARSRAGQRRARAGRALRREASSRWRGGSRAAHAGAARGARGHGHRPVPSCRARRRTSGRTTPRARRAAVGPRDVRARLAARAARSRALARGHAAARRGLAARVEVDLAQLLAIGGPAAMGFGQLLLANVQRFRRDAPAPCARSSRHSPSCIRSGSVSGPYPRAWPWAARSGASAATRWRRARAASLKQLGVQRPDRFVGMMLPAFQLD